MKRPGGSAFRSAGFTLIELLVVVAIIALLISILLPSLSTAKEQAKTVKCGAQFSQVGLALRMCQDEYKGHLPNWDDGAQPVMLTWTDVLNDLNYLGSIDAAFCPTDKRCDEIAEQRGAAWGFRFVDRFGVGQSLKYGVRTSYAISTMMVNGWPEDRYHDTARQVLAAEGWWTWLGNMSADLLIGSRFSVPPGPDYRNWECNKIGYRHGRKYGANIVFADQHVELIRPRIPKDARDFRDNGAIDTVRWFTWLPGEREYRMDNDAYAGSVVAWRGRRPAMGPASGVWRRNPAYPDDIDPTYRTAQKIWKKFPNTPADRY